MDSFSVCVTRRRQEAEGIVSLELSDPHGDNLPSFAAGAHIDVQIAPGVTRQYSLFNSPAERHRYCIAVLKQPDGRGGSRLLHETLHEGDELTVSAPRNAFELDESAAHSVLLAGGIGITPLVAMAQTLHESGRSFELHYCARSRARAAFVAELASAPFAGSVRFHFDDEAAPASASFDAAHLAAAARGDDAHLYVCGPGGFMDHVLGAARNTWSQEALHFERFSPPAATGSGERAFRVVLARSGQAFEVPAHRSLLHTLHAHGVAVPASCEQGVCGTCVVGLLDGEADHRDTWLTDAERREGRQLVLCCSRARSETLTLDL
ncbi:PDR/VanB family oxidoreductase [Paraburkholderia sp. J63]|uniref:PDR/VanB family oxidoreductase n=1 Tax=Paraburkholderia sp. J63 TaxID=2805434 RepID=UPI002ABD6F42|nr:PDR/VanB family oxidoreductase [Paraburkholderia sp. J63]